MPRFPLRTINAIGVAMAAGTSTAEELAREFVDMVNAGHPSAVRFVDGLLKGAPEPYLKEVFEAQRGYREPREVRFVPRERLYRWHPWIEPPAGAVNDDWAYALVVIRIVNARLVNRIRRCKRTACGKVFFGRANRDWCSNNCGSRVRQEKFRLDRKNESRSNTTRRKK